MRSFHSSHHYQNKNYDIARTRHSELQKEDLIDWLLDWEREWDNQFGTKRQYMKEGVRIFNGDNGTHFWMDEAIDFFEEHCG